MNIILYRLKQCIIVQLYNGTWELGTLKGLWKTVLNCEVVLFLRSSSMHWIGLGTGVAVLNSQVVPISQVVLKTGFTVILFKWQFIIMLLWNIWEEIFTVGIGNALGVHLESPNQFPMVYFGCIPCLNIPLCSILLHSKPHYSVCRDITSKTDSPYLKYEICKVTPLHVDPPWYIFHMGMDGDLLSGILKASRTNPAFNRLHVLENIEYCYACLNFFILILLTWL